MTIDKDRVKRHLAMRKEVVAEWHIPARHICPFGSHAPGPGREKDCERLYCGTIFPKWKKTVTDPNGAYWGCPCHILSTKYIIRKFRKWLNT